MGPNYRAIDAHNRAEMIDAHEKKYIQEMKKKKRARTLKHTIMHAHGAVSTEVEAKQQPAGLSFVR